MQHLEIVFTDGSLVKTADGAYHITIKTETGDAALDVLVRPQKPAARHGTDGVVNGTPGDEMFYYCCTRCELTGSVVVGGKKLAITKGQAWYDHEYGGSNAYSEEAAHMFYQYAWNWASVQLTNGWEVRDAGRLCGAVRPAP
jgi:predicted secreted hydrolase